MHDDWLHYCLLLLIFWTLQNIEGWFVGMSLIGLITLKNVFIYKVLIDFIKIIIL